MTWSTAAAIIVPPAGIAGALGSLLFTRKEKASLLKQELETSRPTLALLRTTVADADKTKG